MANPLLSYDLARGLHIVAVIAWMAGMMMLPRLYVYQTESEPGGELDRKMADAARRLRSIIITPSMVLVWVFGIYLLFAFHIGPGGQMPPLWLDVKLALVFALSGWHGYLVGEGRRIAKGERRRSARFWRMTNEIPFIVTIIVVLLATLEPSPS